MEFQRFVMLGIGKLGYDFFQIGNLFFRHFFNFFSEFGGKFLQFCFFVFWVILHFAVVKFFFINFFLFFVPVFVQLNGTLSQGVGQNPQVAFTVFVKFPAVFEHKSDIRPNLYRRFIIIQIQSIKNAPQIHGVCNHFFIIRTPISIWVHRFHEMNSIVHCVFCKIEKFVDD